ncbi:MAG: L-2-amino-thiazoline-4-carboxylic acid hydrolase [Actinomycetota bacterium]|nr:L-2-amino-thiazoline-4-carboxylic acid hydrolase [Actinomycetota bacterium]MDD5667385.1 L-2-amino-thiazoline-4-carboxylic acid hydrolase [Actinomycetota bacterium]
MADERKDFDLEVLGPALGERTEKKERYIDAPLAMQAKLFTTMAKEVIERFGDEGREAVIAAVKRFGEERGRRMAERAAAEGRENSFASFLVLSDLDTGYHQMVPEAMEGALKVTISHCPFAAACAEWGLSEYGKYFCQEIDAAIMRGYNPERYETACERNLTEGAETCVIVYKFK